MVSLHYDEPSEDLAHLPIPRSTMRRRAVLNHHLKNHHNKHKLPNNYFQLSPPTTTTMDENESSPSPPWSWPMIHIVTTRFMQDQGTLVHLARSRLKLLEVICLPSLMKQSILNDTTFSEVYEGSKWEEEMTTMMNTQNDTHKVVTDPRFLWVIKIDPNLDKTVLKELKAVLEPVKQFTLVVGSNINYGIGIKPGGWRDGQAGQDILDAYEKGQGYFPEEDDKHGALQMLRRAHEAREDRVVLETRLDADDAINVEYIAALQTTALRKLVDREVSEIDDDDLSEEDGNEQIKTARWLYWCPHTHVQWNPSSSVDSPDHNPGTLQVFQMPFTCVTPGLTLGFAVGTKEDHVPRYEHSKVYWEIAVNHKIEGESESIQDGDKPDKHHCGLYPSSNCAILVDNPAVSAFRSRAMTSAGMNNIEARGEPTVVTPMKYREKSAQLWDNIIQEKFGIETTKAKEAANFMLTNYLGTVRDNLRGQCTKNHSCKESSLEDRKSVV